MQTKAGALRDELLRQFPHSAIEAHACSVFDHAELFAAELIVDATGEESVSEYLNGLRLQRGTLTPLLHVWIRGNGESVQALWADAEGGACYRCLLVPDASYHRKERFPLLKTDPLQRTDGCRAYAICGVRPDAGGGSCGRYGLRLASGGSIPAFSHTQPGKRGCLQVKNQNLTRMDGCPACARP
jgi:hypothetical protein